MRWIWLFGLLSLGWAILAYVIVDRTGSVIVDGFQSSGAVAGAAGPGSLRWPLLGSFMGYDKGWGFHWFGWPWLRSLLLPAMPWKPSTELSIHCVIWVLASAALAMGSARISGFKSGFVAGVLTLLAPGVLVALQSYRSEIPAALCFVLLAFSWGSNSTNARVLSALLLLVSPMLHPLGLVLPLAYLAASVLIKWRMTGLHSIFSLLLTKGVLFVLGISIWMAWYILMPGAFQQFRSNLESQRILVEGLDIGMATFFKWSLGSRSSVPMVALLFPALAEALRTLVSAASQRETAHPKVLAAAGFLAALLFNIVSRNPNVLHLVAILPIASWLAIDFLLWVGCRGGLLNFQLSATCLLILFCLFPAKQLALLVRQHGVSYRSELADVLGSLPNSRKVLIPVALWEAAASRADHFPGRYRFSTFPNILQRSQRASYESGLMKELRPGDLLVWDPLQDEAGIFNFVEETALRHQVLRPAEAPGEWRRLPDIAIEANYSSGQPKKFELFLKL